MTRIFQTSTVSSYSYVQVASMHQDRSSGGSAITSSAHSNVSGTILGLFWIVTCPGHASLTHSCRKSRKRHSPSSPEGMYTAVSPTKLYAAVNANDPDDMTSVSICKG